MSRKPLLRSGYLYRLVRKFAFLLKRGSLFKIKPWKSSDNWRKSHRIPAGAFSVISINSTFLFLLAYLVTSLSVNIITLLAARVFDIPAILYYFEIAFRTQGYGWTFDAVKVVYSAGPLIAFLLAIVSILLYIHVSEEAGILKLLVLWIFAHSIVYFFGDVVMGSLFNRGFGFVLMYLYVNDTLKMVITIVSICLMVITGIVFTRSFLISANSYFQELPSYYNRRFLLSQFLYPFLAGNLILYLVKLPNASLYEFCLNGTMLFLLIPVIVKGSAMEDHFFSDEEQTTVKVAFGYVLVAVLALAAYRTILEFGFRL